MLFTESENGGTMSKRSPTFDALIEFANRPIAGQITDV